MREPTAAAERTHKLPDPTTVVAMAWVFLTIYGALSASASAWPISAGGWVGTAAMLAICWAVIERRRWGRIAMLGVAATTTLTGVLAVWALLAGWHGFDGLALRGLSFCVAVPATPGDGVAFSAALAVLGAVSVVWLASRAVRAEFERRKHAATRHFQVGIALVLVSLWFLGALGASAHSISHVVSPAAPLRSASSH